MLIDTKSLISMTEANQNFSKVARLVDENGTAVILKNNVPKYVVFEFSSVDKTESISDEELLRVSKMMIEKNKEAYEVLAK